MNFENIKHYLNEHIVIRNVAVALSILLVLLLLIFTWLKIYTRHNEALTVPELAGMSLTEAQEAVKDKKLRVEVFDSVYSDKNIPGTVVEQHPKAGFKVKRNRKIFLTMNAMNPEKVIMPDLIQLTIKQAQSRIQTFGLQLGQISYEPDISINIVLAQNYKGVVINPGDTLIKGSVIDLVLGKGLSNETTNVPDLSGVSRDEATLIAADYFLRIGGAVYDPDIPEEEKTGALVYRQRPEYNKNIQIPLGSSVDIWLTTDSLKLESFLNDSSYVEQDTIQ